MTKIILEKDQWGYVSVDTEDPHFKLDEVLADPVKTGWCKEYLEFLKAATVDAQTKDALTIAIAKAKTKQELMQK